MVGRARRSPGLAFFPRNERRELSVVWNTVERETEGKHDEHASALLELHPPHPQRDLLPEELPIAANREAQRSGSRVRVRKRSAPRPHLPTQLSLLSKTDHCNRASSPPPPVSPLRHNKELILPPILISRTEHEYCLIEASINSLRFSVKVKQGDLLEEILNE